MELATYEPPVSALLTYGSCLDVDKKVSDPERDRLVEQILSAGPENIDRSLISQLKPSYKFESWPDYIEELGITSEHIPALIRMATDADLNQADVESLEVWAPVHAWRCLGLLKAQEAIEPLLGLFTGEEYADWTREEIPWVLGMIGEQAIAPTSLFLASRKQDMWDRIAAVSAFEHIAVLHPELKETCIRKLASQLADCKYNSEELNAFLVSTLVELEAVSKTDLIERVYASNAIDETICGTWPSVQVDLGLAKEEDFDPSELKPEFEWVPRDPAIRRETIPTGLDLPTKHPKKPASRVLGFGKAKKAPKKKKK
ncbi:hypothetical protein S7335_3805 [Synechococcus sp. PCC 7335]|uniref:HEAT repeat domain-containing protein n=1 Tax=Synechococcus sp. (strain ATCC 29403 / PCC 7335) TaxID=91464 RepID=UPI00017ED608|nr:hypothetical protein [Synechococcus sp. PCC 7335]EDX86102.1 hypothetical protein S7335_3805 [Synechococcus sp. PCC 7335]